MTSVLLPFPAFLSVLLFFHSTEYLLAAKYNNVELSWRCKPACTLPALARLGHECDTCHVGRFAFHAALLLSQPYGVAMGAACVEYALEKRLAPYLKVQVGFTPACQQVGLQNKLTRCLK